MSVSSKPISEGSQPNPGLFFDVLWRSVDTAAMKAAIALDVFTAIAEGSHTVADVAKRCQTSERGMRMLCDVLVVLGFMTKDNDRYDLTPDSATFLNRRSPAYMGSAAMLIASNEMAQALGGLADAVRKGGTVLPQDGALLPENPFWVEFARNMAPMMQMPAAKIAELLDSQSGKPCKVLDVAAGHGVFGIAVARRNPNAIITALDWPNVLEVAKQNAQRAGVADRHHLLPGSAFDVDFGVGYDVVLLTNFMHHFDVPTCERLLRKAHAALAPEGRVVILDFVPDESRISPPATAKFCLTMLTMTAAGDTYTFSEYQQMLGNAEFRSVTFHDIPGMPQQVVIGMK